MEVIVKELSSKSTKNSNIFFRRSSYEWNRGVIININDSNDGNSTYDVAIINCNYNYVEYKIGKEWILPATIVNVMATECINYMHHLSLLR